MNEELTNLHIEFAGEVSRIHTKELLAYVADEPVIVATDLTRAEIIYLAMGKTMGNAE